ncbi:MAG: hypothetical protein WAL24_12890, partial [Nitrososphaeraceae archaeon]
MHKKTLVALVIIIGTSFIFTTTTPQAYAQSSNRAIILLMSSSGVRVGALPLMRIKDLEPIDKYNIYKVNVYPKSRKSAYFTFCTPECRAAIDDYIEYRKRFGERISGDLPLFRRDYNAHGIKVGNTKTITRGAIIKFMFLLWRDAGLKNPSPALENEGHDKKQKRNHIAMNHGFRKFWETNAFKAGMDNMHLRRLMGQKSGLEDAYLKLSEEDLLEGDSKHVGYVDVIDQLTINEENKLRREVQMLKQLTGKNIEAKLNEKEKEISLLRQNHVSSTDAI